MDPTVISRGSVAVVTDDTTNTGATVTGVTVVTTGSTLAVAITVQLPDPRAASQVATVLWGTTALTRIRRVYIYPGDIGADFPSTEEIWYLPNATSGTHDLVVTIAPDGTSQYANAIVVCCDEITRVKAAPLDNSAGASGATNTASSGVPASPGQNDCLLYGEISKREAVTRSSPAWSNGFTASTRNGTNFGDESFDYTCATGYKVIHDGVLAAAAKSGFETATDWNALLVVFVAQDRTVSISDTVTASDALGKSVGKSVADTVTAADALGKHPTKPIADSVSASDMMSAAGAHVAGLSDVVSATDEATRAVGKVADDTITATDVAVPSLTGFFPPSSAASPAERIVNPWTGLPFTTQETLYHQARSGVSSCGAAYFAAIQQDLSASVGLGLGEASVLITVALHALPTQLASADEVHVVFSAHEPFNGGSERVAIGITPNGRIVGRTGTRADLLSTPATILADGKPHVVSLMVATGSGGARAIGLDGVVVAHDDIAGGSDGLFPLVGSTLRFMLFNGVDGRTRCACTIYKCEMQPTNTQPLRWPCDEGHGLSLRDQEFVALSAATNGWQDRAALLPLDQQRTYTDYYPAHFGLLVQWYDPTTMGRPLLWGAVPGTPIQSCVGWAKATPYALAGPTVPDYQRAPVT